MSLLSNDTMELTQLHKEHLQGCLKWQAKQGKGIASVGSQWAYQGYNPLSEALTAVLVWQSQESDARAWQAMVRRINGLWWEWYDQITARNNAPFPAELMSWLPRPEEFESDLERLRARVLQAHVIPEGA